MGTILDYLDWRGDLSFDAVPFCDVDNLILSELAYMDFDGIVPGGFTASISLQEAVSRFLRRNAGAKVNFGAIIPDAILLLAEKARDSLRFSSLRVCGCHSRTDPERQLQFSALTFWRESENPASGSSRFFYCAFRGTDDTLVGWKEDFNLSFLPEIPAQLEAADYVNLAAEMLPDGPFYFGGHSKGGNLAVYAAVKCAPALKDRLLCAYSNDGPGFSEEFVKSEEYHAMRPKIRRILPAFSVVGMLLENDSAYTVVESSQSGLFQHDGFSWQVMGNGFVTRKQLSESSLYTDRTLRAWLSEMSGEERADFVSALYDILTASNALTVTDLMAGKLEFFRSYQRLPPESKRTVLRALLKLAEIHRRERGRK